MLISLGFDQLQTIFSIFDLASASEERRGNTFSVIKKDERHFNSTLILLNFKIHCFVSQREILWDFCDL